MCHRRSPSLRAGHYFKPWIEVNHRGRELFQDAHVPLHFRGPGQDLRFERLGPHHRLLQVGAIDGEGQGRACRPASLGCW